MLKESKIFIAGDFCPINRLSKTILEESPEIIFNDLLPIIRDDDLSVVNLECPLTDAHSEIHKTGPALKAKVDTAKTLSKAGFNLVTLANNHIMDYGATGLRSSVAACRDQGIDYVGAGENNTDARKIFYINLGDHSIAVLNFTENEYSTTNNEEPGANPINLIDNFHDINSAKQKADYVFVIVHCGNELHDLPSPGTKKMFHYYAEAGASMVIGHHPHCYSGFEVFKGVPLFYSLGNFLFDDPRVQKDIWHSGFALEIILKESMDFRMLPYEQCKSVVGVKLMEGADLDYFHSNINRLNDIIKDDYQLQVEFEAYCNRVSRMYQGFIEPYTNKIIRYLQNKRLLPSLLSEKKKKLLLNIIRCESHRDVIIHLLATKKNK